MDIFSEGINEIDYKLTTAGIKTTTVSNGNWGSLADDIIERSKNEEVSFPIVIAGHSLGGVEAVMFANRLGNAGVDTDLLIGLDPGFVVPPPVKRGAKKVFNYKIPSGKDYKEGKGFDGEIETIDATQFDTKHTTIDENEQVQELVISHIMETVKKK